MIPVIQVTDLWKRYRLGAQAIQGNTLYDLLSGALRPTIKRSPLDRGDRDNSSNAFWALQGVDFSVGAGDVLGIIGNNGAGKSTLLKVLSRISGPTRGRVELRGRVASLLEVGTGFHPELSGRENIRLNGAILGMTKREIARRFDEIVSFAGVEDFLDTPVKRYSSGMYIRLAFAVASHVDVDILLIDEVLAVGDVTFQRKCLGKMHDAAQSGRTVLFISHNLGAVAQLCSKVMILESGRCTEIGEPRAAIQKYLSQIAQAKSEARFEQASEKSAQLVGLRIENDSGSIASAVQSSEAFALIVEYRVTAWPRGSYVCVDIHDESQNRIIWSCDARSADDLAAPRGAGMYRAQIRVPANVLAPGRYLFTFSIYNPGTHQLCDSRPGALCLEVSDGGTLLAALGIERQALTSVQLEWETLYEKAKT